MAYVIYVRITDNQLTRMLKNFLLNMFKYLETRWLQNGFLSRELALIQLVLSSLPLMSFFLRIAKLLGGFKSNEDFSVRRSTLSNAKRNERVSHW